MAHFDLIGSVGAEGSELVALHLRLREDVISASEEHNSQSEYSTGYASRSLVRTVFAYGEGVIHRMRYVILAAHQEGRIILAPEEIILLKEQTVRLSENGKAETPGEKFTPFKSGAKFVLETYARGVNKDSSLNFGGGSGWEQFKKSIYVRNRVTHPKNLKDLDIQKAEITELQVAFNWLSEAVGALLSPAPDKAFPPSS